MTYQDMTNQELIELAKSAKSLNDDDWGSERQVDAENAFYAALEVEHPEIFELVTNNPYRPTSDEMLDDAIARIVEKAYHSIQWAPGKDFELVTYRRTKLNGQVVVATRRGEVCLNSTCSAKFLAGDYVAS